MTYLTVKAIHILVAMLWIGSLVLVAYLNSKANGMSSDQLQKATRITEAGIGLTWLFGIILVLLGGWYASKWLYLKIFFVFIISAIHTFAHRRWKLESPEPTHEGLPIAIAIFAFATIVVVLFKWPV